ncbi:MAG: hypothetical protein JWO89_723 [Verrucomicrobiaceae bacterium]|nr:hypothetical protein [Verrucomicrobiaceae bacterium]
MNIDPSYLPIVDLLGKAVAVLLLAFGLQKVWQRWPAAQRSLLWLAVFAVLAVLPISLLVQPCWELKVSQAAAPAVPSAGQAVSSVADAEVVPLASHSPALSWWQTVTPMGWAIAIWALGASSVPGFRILGGWQLRRLRRASSPSINKRLHHHLEWLAEELKVRRAIDVRESTDPSVPLTWGWLKPVLLLPAEATTWEDEKLDSALRHELGHIRHHDACTRWLATVVCAVWWPVPLVWMAVKAWKLEQEKACDDLVLRAGATAQDYAMQLLHAARSFSPAAQAAMAMARPCTLETRLRAVMDEQRNRRPMNTRAWALSGSTALLLSSLCVLTQLRASEATESAGAKAGKIILKSVVFRNATPEEAFEFLRVKSRELDPAKTGLNIVVTGKIPDAKITLDLKEVPLNEALLYCAQLSNLEVNYTADAALLQPPGSKPGVLPEGSAVVTHAKQIILPRAEFAAATVQEVIEFLQVKARNLDPKHEGINIINKSDANSPARITLSLINVPVFEVLNYTAELAGLKIEAGEHALILSPKAAAVAASVAPKPSSTEAAQIAAVTKLMEQKNLHLKSCDFKNGRLILVGEATSKTRALALCEELKRDPALAGFQWTFPAPEVKPYGFASFRAEATPPVK